MAFQATVLSLERTPLLQDPPFSSQGWFPVWHYYRSFWHLLVPVQGSLTTPALRNNMSQERWAGKEPMDCGPKLTGSWEVKDGVEERSPQAGEQISPLPSSHVNRKSPRRGSTTPTV